MAAKLYQSSDSQLKNLRFGAEARRKGGEARTAGVSAKITPTGREKLKAIAKSMDLSVADLLEGIASGEFVLEKAS